MSADNLDPDVAEESEEKPFTVQFRITGEQARLMSRLAKMLHEKGAIKTNSINALVKACAFTQVNLYLQFEAKEQAFQQRQMELEQDRLRLEKQGVVKYGTIPNLGTY